MRNARILVAAFTLSLLASLSLPSSARALTDAGFTYTEAGGVATVTGCDGSCGYVVVIPPTLGGYPVRIVGLTAFTSQNLTSVTIPDSVTTIETHAFSQNKLSSIVLSEFVVSIGNYAFYDNLLTSLTVPDSVTSLGEGAFAANLLASVTFLGDAPTTGASNVFDLNEFLTEISRYSNAAGWSSTFLGLPVRVIELPATNRNGPAGILLVAALASLVTTVGFWFSTGTLSILGKKGRN